MGSDKGVAEETGKARIPGYVYVGPSCNHLASYVYIGTFTQKDDSRKTLCVSRCKECGRLAIDDGLFGDVWISSETAGLKTPTTARVRG